MFFLLRCAFWLGVVFFAIFSTKEPGERLSSEISPRARQLVGAAVEDVGAALARACLNAPDACLRAAGAVNAAEERRAPNKQRPAQTVLADHP